MADHHPLAHATLARFKNGFDHQIINLDIPAQFKLEVDRSVYTNRNCRLAGLKMQ
jgi:hypothetical protein